MDLLLAFFVFMASMISAIVLDYSMIFALLAGLVAFLTVGLRRGCAMKELLAMAGRLSTRVDLNRIPRQTVLEETRKCMKGEESADEAVNAIMQKINLYLAE